MHQAKVVQRTTCTSDEIQLVSIMCTSFHKNLPLVLEQAKSSLNGMLAPTQTFVLQLFCPAHTLCFWEWFQKIGHQGICTVTHQVILQITEPLGDVIFVIQIQLRVLQHNYHVTLHRTQKIYA